MMIHKTRKIDVTYRWSKRWQRCETDSRWQTDLSHARYKNFAAHHWSL